MAVHHDLPAALLGVAVVTSTLAARAEAASTFDGSWTVTQSCPPTGQDVRGHSWSFPATVRGGVLSGEHVAASDGGGSLRLQDRIASDGAALLNVSGTVGHADYAMGHLGRGAPVHFHVEARFTATGGSGNRVEARRCDFSFART